jgi:hypothetical protein
MGAGVSIPYSFTKDTLADADQVNANFQALAAKFTGGIYDGDVATAADLDGNKLSATGGKRVPATRLENNAAVDRVVASDPSPTGSDASRAISGDHMKLQTAAQQDRWLVAAGIRSDKLKITYHPVAFSFNTAIGTGETAANPTSTFPKATYVLVAMYIKNVNVVVGAALTSVANDSGANWAGAIRYNSASGTATGTLVYVFLQIT